MPKIQEIGKWYSNYTLFNLEILFLRHFTPLGRFASSALVGGAIQGYDECSAQKNLESKFPKASILIGVANGLLCCALQDFCGFYMPAFYGSSIVSFALATAISENTMCPIEQHAHNVLDSLNQEKTLSFKNLLKSPQTFFGLLMANWSEAFKGAAHAIDEMLPIFSSMLKFPFEIASQLCMALHNLSNEDDKITKSCCNSKPSKIDQPGSSRGKLKSSDGVQAEFGQDNELSHVQNLSSQNPEKKCCKSMG